MTDKMTCEEFWQKALDADDFQMDAAMKAHAEVCADCRAEMNALSLLEKTRSEPTPAQLCSLSRRMDEACEARRKQSLNWRARLWIPLTAAAAAAACGALIFLGVRGGSASLETAEADALDAGVRLIVGESLTPAEHSSVAVARGGMSSDAANRSGRVQLSDDDFFPSDDEVRLTDNSMVHSMAQFEEFFDLGG